MGINGVKKFATKTYIQIRSFDEYWYKFQINARIQQQQPIFGLCKFLWFPSFAISTNENSLFWNNKTFA